jgi:predicted nicotinamide N-methyase
VAIEQQCREMVISGYPTRRLDLRLGSLTVLVLAVARLDDFVDAESLLRDSEAPEPPYWAYAWVGGRALARMIATEVPCSGRRVIEIGCGLGVAGIVAALGGAAVTMIDTVPAALQFARANLALNGCRANVVRTDLRNPGVRGAFDYCVAGDVTYDPMLQTALADFLAAHLSSGGRAWCAESVRTLDQGFCRACETRGLEVQERTVREPDEGREVSVRISEVRKGLS